MAHRYLTLPFSAEVATFDDRVVWIRSGTSVHAAAIDVETGVVRHLVTVGSHDLGRGSLVAIDGTLAATVGRRTAIEWFDAATGVRIRTTKGALCGATSHRSLVVVRANDEDGTRSLVEVRGTSERTLYTPQPKVWELEAVVAGEHIWTIDGQRLRGLALADGGASVELVIPANTSLVAWRDTVLVIEDLVDREGIHTRLHAIDGGALRELAIVDGEVDASRSAATHDLFLASLREGAGACLVDLTNGEEVARVDTESHGCAASREVGVIAQPGAITIVARREGELRTQRIALPEAGVASCVVGERSIAAALQDRLFIVELGELAWRDVEVTFVPVASPRHGDPDPARVVFAGAELVATDHPRLGRVTVKLTSPAPALAKGDMIVIDELRETAPGKFTVVTWHKQGEPASTPVLSTVISRPSDLPERPRREEPEPEMRLPALCAAADRLDFKIPPVLERLLALHDRDHGFRRLLDRISILVELNGGTTTWSGSDPCMLGFAGNGGGDTVALYYYPPAHAPGAELPIVKWMHEDNSVEWVAQSFEVYLVSRLRDAEKWASSVVQAIRARLELPARTEKKAKAPEWFVAAHGATRLRPSADDVSRERSLVRTLRDDPEDAKAKSELLRVYERLGWQWHAEQVLAAEE